tara:strand:- start:4028 stop:5743 length:1716 start_codon:yes stop_codon:yes gene_type:complete
MADLFGDFGLGVVEGLATSTDAYLKKHISDNKDAFDKNLEAALSRNLERSTRYDKDTREAKEALELMAGFTNGDLGDAASAIKGLGGYKQVKDFVTAYRTGLQTNKDLKFSDAITFKVDNPDLTSQQAVNQLVTPLEYTIPKETTKRTGLLSILDDPRSMAVELPRILKERGMTPTQADNLIKLQGAQINWGALKTPEQTVAMDVQQQKLKGLKLVNEEKRAAIDTTVKNLGFMDEKNAREIASHAAKIADMQASTQVRLQALKTARNWDGKKARAAYEASVAATIASKSSEHFSEQYNLLTTEETHFSNELARIETNQGANSNDYNLMARRLVDIRLAKSKISLAGLAAGDKGKMWSKLSPVTAANAIKADAYAAAGLKFKLGLEGRIEMLEAGSADKVYEAAKNAYNNFQSTYGQYKYAPMQAQAEAMRMNMENAKASYVGRNINKYTTQIQSYMRDKDDKTITEDKKANPPPIIRAYKDNKIDFDTLRRLPKGTVVHINNDNRLRWNFQNKRGVGKMAIWTGSELLQQAYPSEEAIKKLKERGESWTSPTWTQKDEDRLNQLQVTQVK